MPFIELSKGYEVEIDQEDFELVQSIGKWYASEQGKDNKIAYAEKRLTPKQFDKLNKYLIENDRLPIYKKTLMMHRVIMNAAEANIIDHIDGNGLNNKKENLRFATRSQNAQNKLRKSKALSKYKCVHYAATEKRKLKKPWRAYIKDPNTNKKITVGYFATEEEAAKAYDKKAVELFETFAKLNFPE